MDKPVIKWQPCIRTYAYIQSNHELLKGSVPLLVTYETVTGRRYVKAVRCYNGRITKRLNGAIIAWAYLPDPYDGESETIEEYAARQMAGIEGSYD